MNLQQLIDAARKAVLEGRMDDAKKYTEQAKALKELDSLSGSTVTKMTDEEVKAMKAKLDEYDAKWEALENEPAHNKAGHFTVTQDETDKKAAQPFRSLGEQLKAIAHGTQYPGAMDERLKAQKAVLGSNEGQQSDGGFLVQQDFSSEIVKIAHDTGMIAPRCRTIGIGPGSNGLKMNAIDETSRANGSRFGGVRGYWLAEGGTLTGSQPKLRAMEWSLKKLGVLMYATDELLMDAMALGGVMQMGASEEFAFLLDDAVLNGTGAGQPQGILTSPALITVAKESGQAAASIVYQNIPKMWTRMHAKSRMNAIWTINQDIEPALYSMDFPVGTGGVPVFLPPGGASASPFSTLYGRPIIPTEFNATLGMVGDIVLMDPMQYLWVDKGGIQAATSIHVAFLTDQQAFRWIYRVDGQSLWHSPLTPYKGTSTQSPFVTLAARS